MDTRNDQSFSANSFNYYCRYDSGHRSSYADTIHRELVAQRTGLLTAFFNSKPFLFLMIEERTIIYYFVCLFRAVLGRTTVGLLFQPRSTLARDSWRRKLKYILLRIINCIPSCRTLAIEPFDSSSEFSKICDDWIYDFQLWDLSESEISRVDSLRASLNDDVLGGCVDAAGTLVRSIVEQREGRRVLCAIGRQDLSKGFENFAQLYAGNPDVRSRYLFAFGGEVAGDLASDLVAFEEAGGVGEDRRISDDDIMGLYATADLVWCHYAIDYDQASGIFGRAVQFGIPVVVRRGSRIHRFCQVEKLAHIAADVDEIATNLLSVFPKRIDPPVKASKIRRKESLAKLRKYILDR